jgi:outer membrane receptor for ferrienterochelin and colicins
MIPDIHNRFRVPHRVRSRLLGGLATGAAALLSLSPVHAQSMDYSSLEQLFGEPVTTSATGSPQRVTEVPTSMTIVTADEIRRSGARDIPGVLRHVGGVDVMQWANNDTDIAIRGYNQAFSPRTLVLIDGRQVYADYYGFVPWSALPIELSAIRQIEIVRGPNAALFGFNAVGGVINIITYNPRYDDVNTASVRTGTQGMLQASGVATIKLGTAGALRLSGGLQSENEFGTPIPPAMSGPPRGQNDRVQIDAYAVFALNDDLELDVQLNHSHAQRNDVNPGYSYGSSWFETNSGLIRLIADTSAGLVKLTAYTNWLSQHGADDPLAGKIHFANQVTVVQAEDVFTLGTDHTIRLAGEYRHNTVDTSPTSGGNIFYDVVSGSAMWSWRISPAVSLTNSVRFDHLAFGRSGTTPAGYPFVNADWNRTIDQYSYNSGLVWKVDGLNTLRLLVSRGVQLPSLANAGALVLNTPFVNLTGVPTLKPTIVSNYELTWDRSLPEITASVHASVFYQHSADVASGTAAVIFTPTSVYVGAANVGDSNAAGLELSANGLFGEGWRWSLSYRAEYVEDRFLPIAAGGAAYLDFMHTTPKHLAKASLGRTWGNWEADVFAGYQSKTSGLQPSPTQTVLVPVGAYVSVDARVAYRLADWATLSVSGQNLLQSPQRQTSGATVERQVFATLSVNF